MTWQNGRQLASLQTSDNSVSYKYDSNGMRTQKTDNSETTYYYYDSKNNLIGMTKSNDTLLFYYDTDGNVTSFKYGDTMYYYVKNLHGDIVNDEYYFPDNMDSIIKHYRAAVLFYAHDSGCHYIMVRYYNNAFYVYNEYNKDRTYKVWSSINKKFEEKNYKILHITGIG